MAAIAILSPLSKQNLSQNISSIKTCIPYQNRLFLGTSALIACVRPRLSCATREVLRTMTVGTVGARAGVKVGLPHSGFAPRTFLAGVLLGRYCRRRSLHGRDQKVGMCRRWPRQSGRCFSGAECLQVVRCHPECDTSEVGDACDERGSLVAVLSTGQDGGVVVCSILRVSQCFLSRFQLGVDARWQDRRKGIDARDQRRKESR